MVSSNRLEPGATGYVKASVDTAGKSGFLVKYVTLYTNDRVTPVRTLNLNLDVVQK